jgi:hypothetical protein
MRFYKRLILIVVATIFVGNIFLFFLVNRDGDSLIISIVLSITEILLLSFTLWYWEEKHPTQQRKYKTFRKFQ